VSLPLFSIIRGNPEHYEPIETRQDTTDIYLFIGKWDKPNKIIMDNNLKTKYYILVDYLLFSIILKTGTLIMYYHIIYILFTGPLK